MAKPIEEARRRLDEEFDEVHRHLQNIHDALAEVERAGPEDDLERLLERLEDEVKKVRTGGLMGHGARGHTSARQAYLQATRAAR